MKENKLFFFRPVRTKTIGLGAAILAGVAVGIFSSIEDAVQSMIQVRRCYEPNHSNRQVYDAQYKKFKVLFRSQEELYDLDAVE